MKNVFVYTAIALIYAVVVGSIVCGIIAMICGVYYFNLLTFTMGLFVFVYGVIMWSMLQEM